ncbi:2-hydroxy-6-oxo-2,4-heptadienoate hydrolase [Pseudomonas sp. FFUP_PS_473]|uniref:alpha/beta fold hydrolase n=1 Tax=Pseudomonas sp. FFUP_PS_473 TaxID=2060418 RepID=UPI000C7B9AC1|nr:alpha/beta fold hydrolase [Pseudomonas sp. FFUP_PS_473]PLP95274.1 2-hydroxy-6-oxo-2,4-heptadienoate hydrolase [Pseudomonas sp. FFUP_PS_473]
MNSQQNSEVGQSLHTGSILTNYHDVGAGEPVLLLHGSGPGVSAWANWRLSIQGLKDQYRLLAPDLAGFGFTQVPDGIVYSRELWLQQIVDFLDALGVEQVNVIGNSFGGSMALALAIHHPQRVKRLILMGSVGVPFELTPGLDAVWGYTPSEDNMRAIMRIFAYDQNLVGDDLVRMRFEASRRAGVHEAYSAMFPFPRQRWVDAMAHDEAAIRGIRHKTLLVHGRDDKVIPLATSLTLQQWIDDSQLHIFGRCGHWTQIEHARDFGQLVRHFLAAE